VLTVAAGESRLAVTLVTTETDVTTDGSVQTRTVRLAVVQVCTHSTPMLYNTFTCSRQVLKLHRQATTITIGLDNTVDPVPKLCAVVRGPGPPDLAWKDGTPVIPSCPGNAGFP